MDNLKPALDLRYKPIVTLTLPMVDRYFSSGSGIFFMSYSGLIILFRDGAEYF